MCLYLMKIHLFNLDHICTQGEKQVMSKSLVVAYFGLKKILAMVLDFKDSLVQDITNCFIKY